MFSVISQLNNRTRNILEFSFWLLWEPLHDIYHFNVDGYREVCAAESFGREFGKYYWRDSVILESGTKSALSS